MNDQLYSWTHGGQDGQGGDAVGRARDGGEHGRVRQELITDSGQGINSKYIYLKSSFQRENQEGDKLTYRGAFQTKLGLGRSSEVHTNAKLETSTRRRMSGCIVGDGGVGERFGDGGRD